MLEPYEYIIPNAKFLNWNAFILKFNIKFKQLE